MKDKDLQELVEYEGDYVLSVYVDTDLARKPKDAVRLQLRNRSKNLPPEAQSYMEAVQRFLDFEYDWQPRGMAVFVSKGFWKVIPLPIAVPTRVLYTEKPYVRVLTDIIDRFGRYVVALVDQETLKIYNVTWGGIELVGEFYGEELRKYKQGGYSGGAMRRGRYQPHEPDIARQNLRQAAEILADYLQGKAPNMRIVLGGQSEVLGQFREILPKPLQERVIGEFPVDTLASPREILQRSLDVAQEADLKEERELVTQAITAAAKGGLGVTGLADTLYTLHQGRVRILLVEEEYEASGFVCETCGYVSSDGQKPCPFCGGTEVVGEPDVVNLAIRKAIETGSDVNIVRQNKELHRVGGIAAILRY